MKTMEFVGTKEMKLEAVICALHALKMSIVQRSVKNLFNAGEENKINESLNAISNGMWRQFSDASRKLGIMSLKKEQRLVGTTPRGYKFIVLYNPKEPKAVEIELWRNREVLTITVPDDDEIRIFGRILHKLSGDANRLKEPVDLNGEVLRLGHWHAAYTCRIMGDVAGYNEYHDEGLDPY